MLYPAEKGKGLVWGRIWESRELDRGGLGGSGDTGEAGEFPKRLGPRDSATFGVFNALFDGAGVIEDVDSKLSGGAGG